MQERDSRLNQIEDEGMLLETTKERNLDQSDKKVVFSNLIKKTIDNEQGAKFVPQRVDSLFMPKLTTFKKTKKREGKPKLTVIQSK